MERREKLCWLLGYQELTIELRGDEVVWSVRISKEWEELGMVGQFIVDEDRGGVYHIPVDKNLDNSDSIHSGWGYQRQKGRVIGEKTRMDGWND